MEKNKCEKILHQVYCRSSTAEKYEIIDENCNVKNDGEIKVTLF